MSNEKEKDINNVEQPVGAEQAEELSTIFSDPTVKHDKVKKPQFLKKILLGVVAVAVVAAITITLVLTVPVLTDDNEAENDEEIRMMNEDLFSGVNKVVLTRKDATIEFCTHQVENQNSSGETEAKTQWRLANIDTSLTNQSVIDNSVKSYMEQTYSRVISENKNDGNDYGFDNPYYKVDFYKEGIEEIYLSLIIGNKSPELSGRYATTSLDNKVYYLRDYGFSHYEKTELSFAAVESVDAITADSSVNNDYFSSGTLVSCDKLVLSGKNLGGTYTVGVKEVDNITVFNSYHITSPVSRSANDENIANIVALFSEGISADACYSFTTTDYDMKKFGLDNPDFSATIYVGDTTRTFSASLQGDGSYAVYCPDNKTIMKVAASALEPATYTKKELFNSFLFIESITAANKLTLSSNGESLSFDISTEYDEESKSDVLSAVHLGKKELTLKNFQNYYSFVLGITAASYDTVDTSSLTPETVLTVYHKDGSQPTTVKYFKVSSGRYQVETNGTPMGLISSSNHSYIVKYAKNVAENKTYNQR